MSNSDKDKSIDNHSNNYEQNNNNNNETEMNKSNEVMNKSNEVMKSNEEVNKTNEVLKSNEEVNKTNEERRSISYEHSSLNNNPSSTYISPFSHSHEQQNNSNDKEVLENQKFRAFANPQKLHNDDKVQENLQYYNEMKKDMENKEREQRNLQYNTHHIDPNYQPQYNNHLPPPPLYQNDVPLTFDPNINYSNPNINYPVNESIPPYSYQSNPNNNVEAPPPPPPPRIDPTTTQTEYIPTESEIQCEKEEILYELEKLKDQGHIPPRTYSLNDSIDVLRTALYRLKDSKQIGGAIRFCRNGLMFLVSGIEYGTNYYNPLKLKLDGWSNSVYSKMPEYDDVFAQLADKYRKKFKVSPELTLLSMLGGSLAMHHLERSMVGNDSPNTQYGPPPNGPIFTSNSQTSNQIPSPIKHKKDTSKPNNNDEENSPNYTMKGPSLNLGIPNGFLQSFNLESNTNNNNIHEIIKETNENKTTTDKNKITIDI